MNISKKQDNEFIKWEFSLGAKHEDIPWGAHKTPTSINLQGIKIKLDHEEGRNIYQRLGLGTTVVKEVFSGRGTLKFCPIEPFHNPGDLSAHLLIQLKQPLLIRPKGSCNIITTFPIEVAAIYEEKGDGPIVLDIFSLAKVKHSLYGSIRDGLICRYWESDSYISSPTVNPLEQGFLHLTVNNTMVRWAEVSKMVFSAFAMKIYYNTQMVSMQANMKISNDFIAETAFSDKPLKTNMRKSPEQFSQGLLSQARRMVMEEGY